jgi:hypothetical protein
MPLDIHPGNQQESDRGLQPRGQAADGPAEARQAPPRPPRRQAGPDRRHREGPGRHEHRQPAPSDRRGLSPRDGERENTNDRSWLRVKPEGTKSSRDGLGAQVSVFDTRGGRKEPVGFRHVQSGSGRSRCSSLEAHVGLGRKPAPDYRVEVSFPATKTRVVRTGVKPGQRHTVRETGR